MIDEAKILEIRERTSIVEVISDYLTLIKVGRNYVGICPFHAEKMESFTVNEEKGIFHCFGCGVGGNVFNFLMQYEHLTFPQAVKQIGKWLAGTLKNNKLKSGDRVKVFLQRSPYKFGTVLYRYPRPEESHLLRIQRDGISHRDTFHERFLKRVSK